MAVRRSATSRRTGGSACSLALFALALRRACSRARSGSRRCRPRTSPSVAPEPARGDRRRSRPTAARSSTAPASPLAIGEQRTTIYADPQPGAQPARDRARRRTTLLGVDAQRALPGAPEQEEPVRLRRALRRPGAGAARFLKKGFAGVGSYPEEQRTYPQGTVGAQVLGYAGVDDTGLGGLELAVQPRSSPAGPASRRSCATRPAARST